MAEIDEFLNPKSMLTPGIAGAVTMTITNSFGTAFDVTYNLSWISLVISLIFGLIVFIGQDLPLWQKSLFYIVNSLMIFSMAIGSNNLGKNIENKAGIEKNIFHASHIVLNDAYASQAYNLSYIKNDSLVNKNTEHQIISKGQEQKIVAQKFFKNWFDKSDKPPIIFEVRDGQAPKGPSNYRDSKQDTQERCQRLCAVDSKCTAYVYQTNQLCYLLTGQITGWSSRPSVLSGVKR